MAGGFNTTVLALKVPGDPANSRQARAVLLETRPVNMTGGQQSSHVNYFTSKETETSLETVHSDQKH